MSKRLFTKLSLQSETLRGITAGATTLPPPPPRLTYYIVVPTRAGQYCGS